MSKLHSKETYIIPEHAINYIVNGTCDNLEDVEIKGINGFLGLITPMGTYTVIGEMPEESFFSWRNDLQGEIGATCKEIEFIFMKY